MIGRDMRRDIGMWKEFGQRRIQTGVFMLGTAAGRDLVSTFFGEGADIDGDLPMRLEHANLFCEPAENIQDSNRTMDNK